MRSRRVMNQQRRAIFRAGSLALTTMLLHLLLYVK
jgi:hypothetical protein